MQGVTAQLGGPSLRLRGVAIAVRAWAGRGLGVLHAAWTVPKPQWRALVPAAACLTWPLAGPAVWAGLLGGAPTAIPFAVITLALWAAGWTLLAAAIADRYGQADLVRLAPPAALVGAAGAAAWGLLAWLAAVPAYAPWLRVAAAALAWVEAAAVLVVGVQTLVRLVRGLASTAAVVQALEALRSRGTATATLLLGAALATCWWGLRLYLHLWVPEPLLTAWVAWPVLTAGGAAALRVCVGWLGAERATGESEGTGTVGADIARYVAPAAYVVAAVALAVFAGALPVAAARAPAGGEVLRARALLGLRDPEAAIRAARTAAAGAAGADALRLAESGQSGPARQLAAAAVAMDPASVAAQEASALVDLEAADAPDALRAAEALSAAGHPGPAAYLASLACAQTKGHGACTATAAAEALWDDPALVLTGARLRSSAAPTAVAVRPDPLLSRAVSVWAERIARTARGGTWLDGSVAVADADLLRTYTQGLSGLNAQASTEMAVAGVLAGAATGDGDEVNAALGPLAAGNAPSLTASVARQLLLAGALFSTRTPDVTAGAVASPLPAPVVKAALAAADAPGAPLSLLLAAANYSILTANNSAGTNRTGEQAAIQHLNRYLARRPRDLQALDDLALAQYELAEFPAAEQAAVRALTVGHGRDQLAQILAGYSLYGESRAAGTSASTAHGDLTAAESHLRAALAINPTPFLVWMTLGDVLDADHQPQAALTSYQQAQKWLQYDLVNHVETFSAPLEGWSVTGLPQSGGGAPGVLQADIQHVQQELKTGGH